MSASSARRILTAPEGATETWSDREREPRAVAPQRIGASGVARAAGSASARFRAHVNETLAIALMLSVVVHFAFFRFFQGFGVPELEAAGTAVTAVELPPEIEIPPPPEAVARPATPTVADVELSEDITIAPTTFEANPVESLGPPPLEEAATDPSQRPQFIAYDTPPRLLNGAQIERLLLTEYPAPLRDAGIGGRVVMWLYVDLSGNVARTVVKESSGHALLDAAAERIASRMRFAPAKNRDKVTAVWVSQPIGFSVK